MQRLLRLPQVMERTLLGRSTIYEMMEAGAFPKPVKLNVRTNAWVESEIDEWVAERISAR